MPTVGFGIVTASILALAAVGFTLQFAISNFLNLAYGNIMTTAAYVGYAINVQGGSVVACLAGGAAAGALVSFLINRCLYMPFLKRGTKLFGMVIVTLSAGIIIQNVLLAISGPTFLTYRFNTGSTFHPAGMILTTSQLWIVGLALAAMVGVQLLLNRTHLGRSMRATAANSDLAEISGVSTSRVVDVAWVLSGGLCGLAGVVLVLNTTAFQSTTGNDFLVTIIAAAILGGVGRPTGAMIAALILGLVTEEAAALISPNLEQVAAFGVLILVLLVRPQGIIGGREMSAAAGTA